jgi:DNA-binding IscR family transcriptional regulator
MYELAQIPTGATLSVRDLCEAADVPENFGASIVMFLTAAGLVRNDGYNKNLLTLGFTPEQITMAQIIRACEPEFSLAQCTREPEACDRSGYCGAHRMWSELDTLVWKQLESITLARVAAGMPAETGASLMSPRFLGLLGTA